MKIRAQVAMVLNLDKCIGCHTCSVTCKNVWTSREGVEYAWFNNVETKPGVGYPKEWENQKKWKGGWKRKANGKIEPNQGSRWRILSNIFGNPNLPEIDDYYEPFTFDYDHLQKAPEMKTMPTARPRSLVTGERMEKVEWGPNWEEILGTEFEHRKKDYNFKDIEKEMYGEFENTFMMYLPRLCEHCINPTCVASCPSGSIYKINVAAGGCAYPAARTRRFTITGKPAKRKNVPSAIRGLKTATQQSVLKHAWAASAIWA